MSESLEPTPRPRTMAANGKLEDIENASTTARAFKLLQTEQNRGCTELHCLTLPTPAMLITKAQSHSLQSNAVAVAGGGGPYPFSV